MAERIKGVISTERLSNGKYDWIITAVERDIGTMPHVERSSVSYDTEQEAKHAGEAEMNELRDS